MTRAPGGGLRRVLGRPALTVYGIGGMLGGGIYALVGDVADLAGRSSWLCFLLAMVVAAPTALAYAELASRYPRSGGEAWYCRNAFRGEVVPFLVGWLVLFSGIVSMAALSRAFAGYVQDVVTSSPTWVLLLAFLAALALLNLRGIRLASTANVVCTVIEASGLVAVILVGASFLASGDPPPADDEPVTRTIGWAAVIQGAALAFYAFIGFEDMVNVAEEVRDPRRAYPFAIPLALGVVGAMYGAVAFVATATIPIPELAASSAPLTEVVVRGTERVPRAAFSLVAVFAVANTALLNFVTTSRLAYGMAGDGLLPGWLAAVHPSWRTPHRAILCLFAIACVLALSGGVGLLAGATSFLLLSVFFTINLALVRLRRHGGDESRGFRLPRFLPWTGMGLSLVLVSFLPPRSILVSLLVVAAAFPFLAARAATRRAFRS